MGKEILTVIDVKNRIQLLSLDKNAPFTMLKKAAGARYTFFEDRDDYIYVEIKAMKSVKNYIFAILDSLENTNYTVVRISFSKNNNYAEIEIQEKTIIKKEE